MELQAARQIIDTLSQGIHPATGEAMPPDSPYNEPQVIRALFTVSQALEARAVRAPRAAASNAGKPWAEEDDAMLLAGFGAGTGLKQLAHSLGRTRFGIEQRLVKFGKVPPNAGGGR